MYTETPLSRYTQFKFDTPVKKKVSCSQENNETFQHLVYFIGKNATYVENKRI